MTPNESTPRAQPDAGARTLPAVLAAAALILAMLWGQRQWNDLRDGLSAEPVVLDMRGPLPAGGIAVFRVSPNGNVDPVPQAPGQLQWTVDRCWCADLKVTMPPDALAALESLSISIGSRTFSFSGAAVGEAWTRDEGGTGRITLHAPDEIRGAHSRIERFDRLRNWPGDGVALSGFVLNHESYRLCVILSVLVLLAVHARQSLARRHVLERVAQLGTTWTVVLFAALVLTPMFLSRISFPLSTEHLEGVQATCTSIWARQGGDLYAAPSIDGCGNIYSPGYYLASRAWGSLMGFSLPSLRGFTWACNLISAACAVFVITRVQPGIRALLWVPLYLSMFCMYGWIDNANKDALHICLSFVGFALLVRSMEAGPRGSSALALAAGAAWACAFMTKQSHVAVAAPALAVALWTRPRQGILLALSSTICAVLLTLASEQAWPHYWDWTFVIPGSHKFHAGELLVSLVKLVVALTGFVVLAASWFSGSWRSTDPAPTAGSSATRGAILSLCAAFIVGGLAMGALSAGKARGGDYAYLPGLAALCIPVAAALGSPIRGRVALVCPLLLLVLDWPGSHAVTSADRTAAERLVSLVKNEPGEVWVPLEPYANVAAGRRAYVPMFCVGEWTAAGREYPGAVLDAVRQRKFSLIVGPYNLLEGNTMPLDEEPFRTITRHYEVTDILPREESYAPKDGWRNSMRLLWRPRQH